MQTKRLFIFVLPFLLLLTTSAAFYLFGEFLGKKQGYFCGFLFYWLFWCYGIPVLLIGKKSVQQLFKPCTILLGKHAIRNIIFLVLPLCFVYSYEFPIVLKQVNALILIASFILSVINAVAEEILWRGMYLKLMDENSKQYIVFSSFGFAIWHFAPQIIFTNQQPGGAVSFVAFAFVLGLLFSAVVKDTQ
jgi:membrane protease YdiL (CAAX protease family)